MKDTSEIRIQIEIGEIEFEAEGSAELVERERTVFFNELLPIAVDAFIKISGTSQDAPETDEEDDEPHSEADDVSEVESLQSEEADAEKTESTKPEETQTGISSIYSSLCADDLNLDDYPEIEDQIDFRKQMMLTLYIVTNEKKGNSFTVADIVYLMTDVIGLDAKPTQIRGVIRRNKTWFKSEHDKENKRAYRYSLLKGAKDYAKSIINGTAK